MNKFRIASSIFFIVTSIIVIYFAVSSLNAANTWLEAFKAIIWGVISVTVFMSSTSELRRAYENIM